MACTSARMRSSAGKGAERAAEEEDVGEVMARRARRQSKKRMLQRQQARPVHGPPQAGHVVSQRQTSASSGEAKSLALSLDQHQKQKQIQGPEMPFCAVPTRTFSYEYRSTKSHRSGLFPAHVNAPLRLAGWALRLLERRGWPGFAGRRHAFQHLAARRELAGDERELLPQHAVGAAALHARAQGAHAALDALAGGGKGAVVQPGQGLQQLGRLAGGVEKEGGEGLRFGCFGRLRCEASPSVREERRSSCPSPVPR